MIQTTFTKQKRELEKAVAWIGRIRAQEVLINTYDAEEKLIEQSKECYVDFAPEEIADKVVGIVNNVVSQHGARQKANAVNTGYFNWCGVNAELTVPQLRALQGAHAVLRELVQKLPRRNPKLMRNTEIDQRPAYEHVREEHKEEEITYVPFEEDSTTRVRTYEQRQYVIKQYTQKVEVDYGLDVKALTELEEKVEDLSTAIQVAIDEANAKGRDNDPVLDKVAHSISQVILAGLPKVSAS